MANSKKTNTKTRSRRAGLSEMDIILNIVVWLMVGVVMGVAISVGSLYVTGYLPRTLTITGGIDTTYVTAVILDTYSIIF